jgi:hypothetical protein
VLDTCSWGSRRKQQFKRDAFQGPAPRTAYAPSVIPKVNFPNLKRLVCVNVLNMFMRDRSFSISIIHFRVKPVVPESVALPAAPVAPPKGS